MGNIGCDHLYHDDEGFFMKRLAIIGAGVSGLTLAKRLGPHIDVTVFEKSAAPGGRLATRHSQAFTFDHGVQFFKAHTSEFQDFLKPYIDQGVIQRWDARFVEINGCNITSSRQWDESYPHYVGCPEMRSFANALAEDVNVIYNVEVKVLEQKNGWQIEGQLFDWVIVTAPSQQTAQLIPSSISLHDQVAQIKMKACFSLMVGFDQHQDLGFDAALVKGQDISWISVNSSKPMRSEPMTLLVHATNAWAEQHIDDELSTVKQYLEEVLSQTLQRTFNPVWSQVHAWRYANLSKHTPQLFMDSQHHIAACGDWCIQGRVEAAFQSASSLVEKIKQELNNV